MKVDLKALRERTRKAAKQKKSQAARDRADINASSRREARPHVKAALEAIEAAANDGYSEAVIFSSDESIKESDPGIKITVNGSRTSSKYVGDSRILFRGVALGLYLWARSQKLNPRVEYRSSGPPYRNDVKIIASWSEARDEDPSR